MKLYNFLSENYLSFKTCWQRLNSNLGFKLYAHNVVHLKGRNAEVWLSQ